MTEHIELGGKVVSGVIHVYMMVVMRNDEFMRCGCCGGEEIR